MPLSNALVPAAKADEAAANPGAARRAEPEEAIAAYGALGHWPTLSGKVLSRSL
jgi:hypothetical protein